MRTRRWRPLVAALIVVTLFVLGACANNTAQTPIEQPGAPQDFLDPVGRFAVDLDSLWNLVLAMALAMFLLVEGLLLFSIFRYRERRGSDGSLPKQVHGNPRLEALWTIIPAALLVFVAVPTVPMLFRLAERPPEALRVRVTGHQWWWEYEYPDYPGLKTANFLHIPTGRTALLEITSADVIHSFWVPKLNGKQDAVPGRVATLQIETDEPGEYFGQCAEYCGLSHANMRLRVIAQPPGEFDAWARQQAAPQVIGDEAALAAAGRDLFVAKGCAGCHTIRGYEGAAGTVGPDLTYFADRDWFAGAIFENTDDNLRRWLDDPPAMKPMQPGDGAGQGRVAGMPDVGLTAREIDQLLAFLRTLAAPR